MPVCQYSGGVQHSGKHPYIAAPLRLDGFARSGIYQRPVVTISDVCVNAAAGASDVPVTMALTANHALAEAIANIDQDGETSRQDNCREVVANLHEILGRAKRRVDNPPSAQEGTDDALRHHVEASIDLVRYTGNGPSNRFIANQRESRVQ